MNHRFFRAVAHRSQDDPSTGESLMRPMLCLAAVIVTLALGPYRRTSADEGQQVVPEAVAAEGAQGTPDQGTPDAAQGMTDEQSAHDNLLREMTTTGIALSPDVSYTLPTPTFVSITGELVDPASAEKSLEQIAGPQGVSRFVRNSIVAPLAVRTDAIENAAGQRIGHFIDVAFVVHQSIAEIRQSKVLDDFKSDADAESGEETGDLSKKDQDPDDLEKSLTRSLTAAERSQYGVTLDKSFESLGVLQLPIMSKVVLRGVARARRSVWSTEDESAPIILTWLLDARFGSASPQIDSITNQWRAIQRNEVGQRVLGPPHPYAGMGGYVAVAPLPGDAASSIVQIRFVIHEPPDWFHGRNLLRSKLPLLIQDRVRNIRRELQD